MRNGLAVEANPFIFCSSTGRASLEVVAAVFVAAVLLLEVVENVAYAQGDDGRVLFEIFVVVVTGGHGRGLAFGGGEDVAHLQGDVERAIPEFLPDRGVGRDEGLGITLGRYGRSIQIQIELNARGFGERRDVVKFGIPSETAFIKAAAGCTAFQALFIEVAGEIQRPAFAHGDIGAQFRTEGELPSDVFGRSERDIFGVHGAELLDVMVFDPVERFSGGELTKQLRLVA